MKARKQNGITIIGPRIFARTIASCVEDLRARGYDLDLAVTGGWWTKTYQINGDEDAILLLAKALLACGVDVEGLVPA